MGYGGMVGEGGSSGKVRMDTHYYICIMLYVHNVHKSLDSSFGPPCLRLNSVQSEHQQAPNPCALCGLFCCYFHAG